MPGPIADSSLLILIPLPTLFAKLISKSFSTYCSVLDALISYFYNACYTLQLLATNYCRAIPLILPMVWSIVFSQWAVASQHTSKQQRSLTFPRAAPRHSCFCLSPVDPSILLLCCSWFDRSSCSSCSSCSPCFARLSRFSCFSCSSCS